MPPMPSRTPRRTAPSLSERSVWTDREGGERNRGPGRTRRHHAGGGFGSWRARPGHPTSPSHRAARPARPSPHLTRACRRNHLQGQSPWGESVRRAESRRASALRRRRGASRTEKATRAAHLGSTDAATAAERRATSERPLRGRELPGGHRARPRIPTAPPVTLAPPSWAPSTWSGADGEKGGSRERRAGKRAVAGGRASSPGCAPSGASAITGTPAGPAWRAERSPIIGRSGPCRRGGVDFRLSPDRGRSVGIRHPHRGRDAPRLLR